MKLMISTVCSTIAPMLVTSSLWSKFTTVLEMINQILVVGIILLSVTFSELHFCFLNMLKQFSLFILVHFQNLKDEIQQRFNVVYIQFELHEISFHKVSWLQQHFFAGMWPYILFIKFGHTLIQWAYAAKFHCFNIWVFDSFVTSLAIVPRCIVKKIKRKSTKSLTASAYRTLLLSSHHNSRGNFANLFNRKIQHYHPFL